VAARHHPLLSPATGGLLRRLGFSRKQTEGLRLGRVVLRAAEMADFPEWAALRGASREFLTPWESTWPEDALSGAAFRRRLRQYTDDLDRGAGYYFLIRRAADDVLLGGINLTHVRRGIAQSGTLGYWIGAPFARQGYMTEAMNAVLAFAFETLALNRVEAACLPDNAASRALLARCGFTQEGRARKYLRINGIWQDHLTFAILREDWRAQSGRK
jgi:ribosomal-protein-alanine N-acetyltransferase